MAEQQKTEDVEIEATPAVAETPETVPNTVATTQVKLEQVQQVIKSL